MSTEPMASLLTRQEAQDFLRVSRTTLMRLVREGLISAIRIGGYEYRFSRADLQEFLERSRFIPEGDRP